MLIEFSVENYRSFRDKATLSLAASPDNSLPGNLIVSDAMGKDRLLRSAVVYGANASGKSNLLMAIQFLRNLVVRSHGHQKGQRLIHTPFRMDKKSLTRPSKFEIAFMKNGTRYEYSVSLNADRIVDEWLYFFPKGRRAMIFERRNTDKYDFTKDKAKQTFISESTLDNALYLSTSTQLKYKMTTEAFEWFKDNLKTVLTSDIQLMDHFAVRLVNEDKKMKEAMLKALAEADVGIEDIDARIKRVPVSDLGQMPAEFKRILLDNYRPEMGPIEEYRVTTTHKSHGEDGEEMRVLFDLVEESEGTRRIFGLMGQWLDALKNGRVLVIDELDVKLHPMLNVFLVGMFHDPTQNKKGAQLVFATHNISLLDQDLFRRDQIWFTERNPETGSSDLYSLVEFSPRKDKNLQKGYLAGRYGALPFIQGHKVFP